MRIKLIAQIDQEKGSITFVNALNGVVFDPSSVLMLLASGFYELKHDHKCVDLDHPKDSRSYTSEFVIERDI